MAENEQEPALTAEDGALPIAELLARALEDVTEALGNWIWLEIPELDDERESGHDAVAAAKATLARFAKLKEIESRPPKKVKMNLSVSIELAIPADEDPIDMFNRLVTYSFDSCDPSIEVLDTSIEDIEEASEWQKYRPGML